MGKAEFRSKDIPVKIKDILAVSKKLKLKIKLLFLPQYL